MTVKSNADRLVSISVMGNVSSPSMAGLPAVPYMLTADGQPFLWPAWGGIVYNVSVGDSAFGWLADCVHPGVSINVKDDMGNRGLNILSCVGNTAVVMSGSAAGAKGIVTGKSGRFSEQVIIHFDKATREKMAIGDKIVVARRALAWSWPTIRTSKSRAARRSCSMRSKSPACPTASSAVPVVGVVPPHLLGAGAGLGSEGGSIHIQTADKNALKEAGLDQLRLGDVVALGDYDSSWGHGYLRGAVGIGVVGQATARAPVTVPA